MQEIKLREELTIEDDPKAKTAKLDFVSCSFISKERTADYTTTYRLREMVKDKANVEDIIAYLSDRHIPAEESTLEQLAKQILTIHRLLKMPIKKCLMPSASIDSLRIVMIFKY